MRVSKAGSQSAPSCADDRLRTAFAAGKPLQLDSGGAFSKSGTGRPGIRQVIHARLIRDLLLSDPVPGRIHQVSVCEADIQGELDLRFAKTECALRLEHCTFHAPVRLCEAHLQSVSFRSSTVPEIDARHVTVTGDLVLDEVEVAGQVRLSGAHLEDDLHLARATVGSSDRSACVTDGDDSAVLDLRGIHIKGRIDADQLTVLGQVSTAAATVGATAQMTNMRIRNPPYRVPGAAQATMAWDGDGMKVEGILDASGLHVKGQVRLVDAQVLCLVLQSAQITNAGNALVLDRLDSRGSVYVNQDSHLLGGIHAIAVKIGASLYLSSSLLRAPASGMPDDKEHALDLRRAKIKGDLRCEEGFQASGACDLTGSHVTGRVGLNGARLRSAEGAAGKAFSADNAQLGGALYGENGFTVRGGMSLINAQVGGHFTIEQNEELHGGLSLTGDGLAVARNVNLNVAGIVHLSGATINGDFMLNLERLENRKDQAAADLSDVKAGALSIYGRPKSGFLDLARASVTRLRANPADWPEGSSIVLDGLAYSAIASNGRIGDQDQEDPDWITWLKTGTQWVRSATGEYFQAGFAPQPYQHLAGLYQQSGDDRKARAVLHAMYCRHNMAKVSFWRQPLIKIWNVVQDIFLGYGYVPWRAVVWLAVLTVGATGWFLYFGQGRPGIIQSALLSLGLVLPGSGYEKLEPWKGGSDAGHLIAAVLVMCGLLLGASVIAALGRGIRR